MTLEHISARFLAIMRQEKEIYDELAGLSDKKQPAILQKDIHDLDIIVRKEQGAVLRLGQLEKLRTQCAEDFAVEHGVAPDTLSMLKIAQMSPAPYGDELRGLHGELQKIAQKLSAQNQAHRSLLEGRLEYVRFAIDFLSDEQGGGYSSGGHDTINNKKPNVTLIDRKV